MKKQATVMIQQGGGGARALAALLVSTILIHSGCASRQAGAPPRVDTRLVLLTPEQALAYAEREQLRASAASLGQEASADPAPRAVPGTAETAQDGSPRRPARVRVLQVGRSIDPADPRVMHESHSVFILDEDESWELQRQDGKLRLPGENPPSPRSSPEGAGR